MVLIKVFYLIAAFPLAVAFEAQVHRIMPGFLNATTRIVNGKRANEYESFGFSAGPLLCGGTLIHDDIFLTAAHCKDVFLDGVILGGTTINGSDKRLQVSVEYEIPHPNYVDDTAQSNDIMLVKLSNRVTSLPFQSLANVNSVPVADDILTAIGYGSTTEGGDLSFNLLEVDLDVSDFGICNTLYGGILTQDTQFCTYTENKDTCQGDSGGPLINANGLQVGIVSFGSGCARPGAPAVNVRVGDYASWIAAGICEHSDYEAVFCTFEPTQAPNIATSTPSYLPSSQMTTAPSEAPSLAPTDYPTTQQPSSVLGTNSPSLFPTRTTDIPSRDPTVTPTATPYTSFPTNRPTSSPTPIPTESPTPNPTTAPSVYPTPIPSLRPTQAPSSSPTMTPSLRRTSSPSGSPTNPPSPRLVVTATHAPSKGPTRAPRRRSFWALIRWYFFFYFRSWFRIQK